MKSSGSTLLRPKNDQRRETGTVLLHRPNAPMSFVIARRLQFEGRVEGKQENKCGKHVVKISKVNKLRKQVL